CLVLEQNRSVLPVLALLTRRLRRKRSLKGMRVHFKREVAYHQLHFVRVLFYHFFGHRGRPPATRTLVVGELDYRDFGVRGAGPGLVVDRDLDERRIGYFQKDLHLGSLPKLIGIRASSLGLDPC